MSYDSEFGGFVAGEYASANFEDAEETKPIAAVFDIGGHGVSTPYTAAVNAIVNKHSDEIRAKTSSTLQLPSGWRKRLRDFLVTKNNTLLNFLSVSVPSHPILGPGEVLIRRFGNPQVSPTHPSVREFVLDASGEDVLADIDAALQNYKGVGGLKDYVSQTSLLYDEYRMAGEAILKAQGELKKKLDRLDRIQGKLSLLFEIEANEKWGPLMEATESYLAKIFEECAIEEDYTKLMAAYRRFAVMRDVVLMTRVIPSHESDPMCGICLNEPVSFAFAPCGHTFCQSCARRHGTSCPFCRAHIRDRIKIFFS